MNHRLDQLLAGLKAAPLDRSLVRLEADVAQRLDRANGGFTFSPSLLAPMRAATVGVALMLGISVGGMTAASAIAAPKTVAISVGDELAPSTLLEGSGH